MWPLFFQNRTLAILGHQMVYVWIGFYMTNRLHVINSDKVLFSMFINSFAANVVDRRHHSRPPPTPGFKTLIYRHSVLSKVIFTFDNSDVECLYSIVKK